MAKKNTDPESNEEPSRGLSQGAWVAIGTIGAALIAGVFTLVPHLFPSKPSATASPSPAPSPTVPVSSISPSPNPAASPTAVTTADAMAGKWAGTAKDGNGAAFQITLEVKKSCGLNQLCGSISVSHVPCEGEIFLEAIKGDVFEFRVANFSGRSNRDVCQPGAGELFRLRPDGKLSYTTSYDSGTEGTLERVGG